MKALETHTHTHTHTRDDYSNPRCACAPRVNKSLPKFSDGCRVEHQNFCIKLCVGIEDGVCYGGEVGDLIS